jgi:hypothetical protein
VAFVNGGILGVSAYAHWLRTTFPDDREIHAERFVLTEGMTFRERAIRRVMCQRLWPDPAGIPTSISRVFGTSCIPDCRRDGDC